MSFYEPGSGKALQCEQTVTVELDMRLLTISSHLTQMMLEVQGEIKACGYSISAKELRPVKRMAEFETDVQGRQNAPERDYVLRLISKFYKLHRLLQAGLSECYETVVNYAADLRGQAEQAENSRRREEQIRGRTKKCVSVAEEIVADSGFRRVEEIALGGLGQTGYKHPKVEALVEQCRQMLLLKRRGLVFVGNKLLGKTLADRLWKAGIRAGTLMGDRSRHKLGHQQAAQRLISGEADFLICTSVLEGEGIYPELTAGSIICYTPPQTLGSKLARQSHGSDNELTFVSNLVASQSPDCTFWLLRREAEKEAAQKAAREAVRPVQLNLGLAS